MTDKNSKSFPNIPDYLVFLGIFLVGQIVGAAVAFFSGLPFPDWALINNAEATVAAAARESLGNFMALCYGVAMLVTLFGFMFYRRQRGATGPLARFSLRGFNPLVLLWGLAMAVSASVVLDPLLELMPDVPDIYGSGVWAFVTLVVMAPVFEEFIFRGALLESTRARYGVVAAWLVSSLMFGLIHIYPAVALNACVIGLVLGFVYIVTDSLWATIILHAVNNALAYVLMISGFGDASLMDVLGNRALYMLVYVVALIVLAVSGYMIVRTLRRLKDKEESVAESGAEN